MSFWTKVGIMCLSWAVNGPTAILVAQQGELPPPGFGSLRQDQVGVRILTDNLAVRLLPLDERVIRLLASDTYRSLSELTASRATEIAQAARTAGSDSVTLMMVTFFGLQPQTRFSADEVYVTSQNRLFRPIGIVPLTAGFSEATVDQRRQAAAIYLFEPGIDVLRPFQVRYAAVSADGWSQSLRLLEAERTRVFSRSQQAQPPR